MIQNKLIYILHIRDGGRFYENEFDPTNPDFFRHLAKSKINAEERVIGRTTLIYSYEFFGTTHIPWGGDWFNDNFEWGDNFGDILYPPNHYDNIGATYHDLPVLDPTLYEGGDTPRDPLNLITGSDAVVTINVGSGGSGKGNRLKLTKS